MSNPRFKTNPDTNKQQLPLQAYNILKRLLSDSRITPELIKHVHPMISIDSIKKMQDTSPYYSCWNNQTLSLFFSLYPEFDIHEILTTIKVRSAQVFIIQDELRYLEFKRSRPKKVLLTHFREQYKQERLRRPTMAFRKRKKC